MKLIQHEIDTNQSCSCTSCLHGSDSDRASLKRVKAGSRIDKLYFGKYLPLREKKLLDKLVRTRAVYDDVRNQLLSESSSSIGNKAKLKPRKQLPQSKMNKEHDYTEKSSDIFELVDLVDRVFILGQKKISECCSCCSCSSKIRLHDHTSKGFRHRNVGGHFSSKSSAISRQRIAHDIRLGKHVRYAKHIRSDPCICTSQFSDLSKQLNTTLKEINHKQPQPLLESLPFDESYPKLNQKNKHNSVIQSGMGESNRKGLKKIIVTTQNHKQRVETSGTKSIKKENQTQPVELNSVLIKEPALGEISRRSLVKCACKVKENIELGAIKSLEKIKDTKQKVKDKIEASIRKSVQKENQKQKNDFEYIPNRQSIVEEESGKPLVKCACKVKDSTGIKDKEKHIDLENALKMRKDSLTVYKKQLQRKRQLKDWECDFECFAEECVPEKCYGRKKRRRAHRSIAISYRKDTQRKMKETEISSASDANVQANNVKKTITTATQNQKLRTHENGNNLVETRIGFEVKSKKQGSRKEIGPKQSKKKKPKQKICTCEEIGPSYTGHKTKSAKSMTNLPPTTTPLALSATTNMAANMMTNKASRSPIKRDKVPKASKSSTDTTKLTKASLSTTRIDRPLSKGNSESDLIQNSRQAVRIGSSFSFDIEFYKSKPITKIPTIKQKVTSKDNINLETRKSHHRHRASGTRQRQAIANTQAGEYALKRCFCTLKLKTKRTKSKINKSFAKERKASNLTKGKLYKKSTKESANNTRLSPVPDLLPYEYEPVVCIPGTCNPKDCEEIIKKRAVKYNSIQTNTNYKTKYTPSITTKSVSDVDYKKIQATENKKLNIPKKHQPSSLTPTVIPLSESAMPQKQVVRIRSSFSFNIEFTREKSPNIKQKYDSHIVKLRGNKSEKVNEKNGNKVKPIQHKLSQLSSSTTKSRYSSTKHKLRRCLCTLGLGKPVKKKERTKSRGNLTDGKSITQIRDVYPPAMSKAIETEKKQNFAKHFKHKFLPYECEPGTCVPGECIPHECKEIITKREAKLLKGHTKQSHTEYRRTKSTYSFIPKSKPPLKLKKVQSTSPILKSKVQKNATVPREARLIVSSPNRQAVRIGSNFNFNVEFYKYLTPPIYNSHINNEYEQSKHVSKNVRNEKCGSTQVQKKVLSILIGPAIKRCFCTSKLQKSGKKKIKSNVISTGTETIFPKEEMYPKMIKATKGTKTNKLLNNINTIEPFECEPYICIPGKCDPYQCLEIMKRRDVIRQSQEFDVSTNHVKKKSTASVTYKSAGKTKEVQSYTEHQKSNTKKRRRIKYSIPNDNSEYPLRQAVIISSNFSFNVEFFKNRKSGEMSKVTNNTKSKFFKVKGGKSLKTSSQRNSETLEIKKNHRASGVEHVLKRCFCTLKLQNKVKQQDQQYKTYIRPLKTTAMPIQVFTNRMNLVDSKTSAHIPIQFKGSNIHYKKENAIIIKPRKCTKCCASVKYAESLFTKINDNQSRLIGLSPFLRSCFCTMNIQVEKSGKNSHKLKPYECEPGICVPDECDPYVCQKLIIKRLMKRVSTMTGTKIRSKSSGTTVSSPESKAKKNQFAITIPKDEKEQRSTLKYEPHMPHRQAVCVGSNFSFNIELYKDRSPSASTPEEHNEHPKFSSSIKHVNKKLKNTGTKGLKTNVGNKSSQSEINTQHRASTVAPIYKKCLCTLKLQKQGRQHNAIHFQVNERKKSLLNNNDERPKVRTTETSQNTPKSQSHLYDLNPYECEPLVCVPGECDPYKCLELIHKRNKKRQTREFGIDSIRSRKRSASSLTTHQNRQTKKKQIQASTINTKPRYSTKPINESGINPSREAVRIGSSCSFNIEFYKDRSPSSDRLNASSLPQYYVKKEREIIKDTYKHPIKEKNKSTEHSSQDAKSVRHRDSQVKNLVKREKSTKTTSFIKRCFCTAKLHDSNNLVKSKVKQNPKDSSSFLKRCLCKLKSITAVKKSKSNIGTETLIRTDKFIKQQMIQNTHDRDHRPQILGPYECELGVCVPGECDPYVCEKKIKKRQAKLHTKMSITDTPGRRSISTSHKYSKASKGILTQSKEKNPHKENPEFPVKKQRKQLSLSPERNVVRIGSNFSFDIEFYKNKTPHFNQVQKVATAIKEASKEGKSQKIKGRPKSENKRLSSNYILFRNRKSQVKSVKKENRASGIGPMLKRCFCTLKLHNHLNAAIDDRKKDSKTKEHANTSRFSTKSTETFDFKELPNVNTNHAKTYNLKPYECEPNICIPGECNPYECEKLIRKRLRESGTSTQKRKMKSTTSMIKAGRKSKDKTQQFNVKYKTKQYINNGSNERVTSAKPKKPISLSFNRPSKQAVRIGSSFSFDIELLKNKEPHGSMKHKASVPQDEVIRNLYTNQPSIDARNKKSQHSKTVRHMDSQVLNKKVRSKMSQVTPFLKRCFCTLKLHKPDIDPKKKQSVATITNKKIKNQHYRNVDDIPNRPKNNQAHVHHTNLDPHECEPGICVPGKCDPYRCEERIKMRKEMQSKLSGTVGSKHQSTSSLTPLPKSFKDKNSQGNLLEQNNLKTTKDKPTKDSQRQAVRVGSSFSFDIEFYREKTQKDPYLRDKRHAPDMSEKKHEKNTKMKNIMTDHRVSFRHRQSQLKGVKTESKGFGVEPLLKRCFCTLKFQKVGKLQQPTIVKLEPKVKDSSATANIKYKQINEFMRNAGSETKMHGLKLYECEPYVCIPGECDPFECEKRIKMRNFNELGTGTKKPTTKSVSSLSRSNKVQTKKNQATTNMYKERNLSINKEAKKVRRFSHNLHKAEKTKPPNRQAVRIGSNFSFNVEFYKERSPHYNQIIDGNNKALKGKSEANVSEVISVKSKGRESRRQYRKRQSKCQASCGKEIFTHNRKLQVADLQKESRGSGMAPALKRCFCTLTLQKKDIQNISNLTSAKTKPTNVNTRNKTTLTKAEPFLRKLDPYECEPGTCIPGECNPYECQEIIKKRDIKRKSKKSSTRRYSQISVASVAAKSTPISKSKRLQYNVIDERNQNDSVIVEQPRFPFIFDRISDAKQAVKINSNFSFNIEFYKEKSPKEGLEVSEYSYGKNQYSKKADLKPTSGSIKMTNTNICKLKNCKIQAQGFETKNRASAVDHALKRCFCTLKLRPNVVTVGRVDKIQTRSPFMPSQPRDKPLKSSIKNKKSSQCPFICMTSTKNTKTVATKINEKYLMSESLPINRYIENQETQKNTRNMKKNDSTDMKTILPYTPRKFNKNMSKTLLRQSKKERNLSFDKECCLCCKNNLNQKYCADKDKDKHKMRQSKSKTNVKIKLSKGRGKTIEFKETNETPNSRPSKGLPKGFLCRCLQLFSKKNNNSQSVSNECPFESPNCQTESEKKSQKEILKPSKSERRPKTPQTTVPKKSKSLKMTKLSETNKAQRNKHQVEETKKYSRFQGGDAGQSELSPVVNNVRNPNGVLDKKFICLKCQARKSKRQNKLVKFTLTPTAKGKFESTASCKKGNFSKQTPQKNIGHSKSSFLGSLGTRFCTNDQETKQYVGTLHTYKTNQNESLGCICVCCGHKKESSEKEINKDTELGMGKKITGLNYKYVKKINPYAETGKACPCYKRVKDKSQKSSKENRLLLHSPKKTVKKCFCGSSVCGKESKKQYVKYTKKPRKKPCVCGSVTCARMIKKNIDHTCTCYCECGRITDIAKRKKQMKNRKEYLARKNQYSKEDRARKIQRIKANAKMLKNAMKYRNSSDVVLAAQSVCDIAKLGCTALVDVGRSTCRTITDPKYTFNCLKTTVRDPSRAWKGIKAAVSDSGAGETCKRVKLRVGAMSCMKKAKSKLEKCAFTNYLLHMTDTNPKKRLKRKPRKRKREQIDFGCSLFMSSLRKRPFLSVYNLCPWFYPHCLSMLNIWKQFSDIMLFLLAVVVWSPCILCMEGCRAMMCCFLCTG